jgi:hypothetical protein
MNDRTPFQFRPMDELDHEHPVEIALVTGQVVTGRMIIGITTPASRTYYERIDGSWFLIGARPIGWREVPTPQRIAAWKELAAA